MPSGNHNMDITKNVMMIETLKAEIVTGLGQLYQAMYLNQETEISDSLANLIIRCYILSKRLGIPFSEMDSIIEEKMQFVSEKSEDFIKFREYLVKRSLNNW